MANWVALAVLALHWFNPLAWYAFRAFRADQEMANDARVLARLGSAARHAYACAIVKAAHGGAIALGHPLGASGTKLMTTLVHALRKRGGGYGLQTMCEGGGIANVTIIEAL